MLLRAMFSPKIQKYQRQFLNFKKTVAIPNYYIILPNEDSVVFVLICNPFGLFALNKLQKKQQ